jgi:hypothetical protein
MRDEFQKPMIAFLEQHFLPYIPVADELKKRIEDVKRHLLHSSTLF